MVADGVTIIRIGVTRHCSQCTYNVMSGWQPGTVATYHTRALFDTWFAPSPFFTFDQGIKLQIWTWIGVNVQQFAEVSERVGRSVDHSLRWSRRPWAAIELHIPQSNSHALSTHMPHKSTICPATLLLLLHVFQKIIVYIKDDTRKRRISQ